MTRSFQRKWKDLGAFAVAFALVTLVLAACSGGVKQSGSLGWKADVVGGSQQITLPRRPFPNPVEIIVRDPSGQPVIDAAVEFRLVDQALIGTENIDATVLEKAFNTESAAQTSSDAVVRKAALEVAKAKSAGSVIESVDEKIGRIDQFEARTNRDGKAKVWVVAPTYFNKKIAVLVKAGNDPAFGASYSYALLTTSDLKEGSRLFISTDHNKKEKVGDEFDLTITVADTEGRVASTFEGLRKIKIEANPATSWGGFKPQFPSGEFDCTFNGGRCIIPRGPYKLRVPETFQVKLSFVDGSVSAIEDTIEATPDGQKAFLVLKNKAGLPDADTKMIPQISQVTGTSIELFAAFVDASGNFVEDAANATWKVDSDNLKSAMSATTGARVVFAPTRTGTGYLEVSSGDVKLFKPVPIIAPAGEHSEWRFRINHLDTPPDIPAATCVDVDVYASDSFGNVNPTVSGLHLLTLKIENSETAPVLAKDAHWGDLTPRGKNLVDEPITLSEGLAQSISKACFYDATAPNVKLTVSGKNNKSLVLFSGQLPLKIVKNKASRLMIVRGSDVGVNDAARNVCTRSTQQKAGTKPCLVWQMGTPEKLRLAVVDAAGNWLRYAKATWSVTNEGFTFANPSAAAEDTVFTPAKATAGMLTATATDLTSAESTLLSDVNSIDYEYEVVSGLLSETLTTEVDGGAITAGIPFKVKAKLLDTFGNPLARERTELTNNDSGEKYWVAQDYNRTNITVTQAKFTSNSACHTNSARPGFTGFTGLVDTLSIAVANVNKGFIAFGDSTFKLLRASRLVGDQPECRPTLSIQVKIGDKNVSSPGSNQYDVLATTVEKIILRGPDSTNTGAMNTGADFSMAEGCTEASTGTSCRLQLISSLGAGRTLYAAGYDTFGNFVSDQQAEWSWFNVSGSTPDVYNGNYISSETLTRFGSANLGSSTEVKLNLPAGSDKLKNGSGYVQAKLGALLVNSRYFDFVSEVATKYIVDFIDPGDLKITLWSSADNKPQGDGPRILEAGRPFAIRLRAVDASDTAIGTYLGTKTIRISIPEFRSWGKPNDPTVQWAKKWGNLAATQPFLVTTQCVFEKPPVGRYDTTYSGSECIFRDFTAPTNSSSAFEQFSLVDITRQSDILVSDLTLDAVGKPSTINNPVIVTAQPVKKSSTNDRELVLANKCGGPDNNAAMWFQNQAGMTKSSNDLSVPYVTAKSSYKMTADETLELYPALIDKFGNYLQEAPDATLTLNPPASAPAGFTSTSSRTETPFTADTNRATCKSAYMKFTFVANTSTELLTQPVFNLSASFSKDGFNYPRTIPMIVTPGEPSKLQVRLAAEDGSLPSSVTAGTCLAPKISVRDTDNNLVHTYSYAVAMNLTLDNYYTPSATAPGKQLVHPGGLYKKINGNYIPITNIEPHTESETPTSATSTSAMDTSVITYFASEKSDRVVIGGELSIADRFICFMDADSNNQPNLKVKLKKDLTSADLLGESANATTPQQPLTIAKGPASYVDFRLVSAGGLTERQCRIPFSITNFPVYVNNSGAESFEQITADKVNCRALQVSDQARTINAYWIDKVGNLIDPAPAGSWSSVAAPVGTTVCGTLNGTACANPSLALTNLNQKGSLSLTWNPPGTLPSPRVGDLSLARSITIPVKSGPASKFNWSLNRETNPSTDDAFGIVIRLQDQFGNDFDPPSLDNFNYSATASFTYQELAGQPAPNDPTNANGILKRPATQQVNFIKSASATTANIFRFPLATNNGVAKLTVSMAPVSNLAPVSVFKTFTVLAGAAAENKIYYSDTEGARKDQELISTAGSWNTLTSKVGYQQVEVRALDAAGNVTASPAVDFAWAAGQTLPALVPHPSLSYATLIPLNTSGTGSLSATVRTDTSKKTPNYGVKVTPANASKFKLVRVADINGTPIVATAGDPLDPSNVNGSNPPVTAGGKVWFKIVATDDQDNIVETFNNASVTMNWDFGTYPSRSEGGRAQLPGCANDACATPVVMSSACNFRLGVCRVADSDSANPKIFEATLYGATGVSVGQLQVKATVNSFDFIGTHGAMVKPGAFHHFGVVPTTTQREARVDKSDTFNVTVDARDQYGNTLTTLDSGLRSTPISLQIRRTDATTLASGTLGGLPGTAPTFGSTDTTVTFSGLGYDEPGTFLVMASGPSNANLTTAKATQAMTFNPVIATIKDLRLVFGAGVTEFVAGVENTLRLEAVDAYGNPIRGLDTVLNSHTYQWTGIGIDETVRGVTRTKGIFPTQFNNAATGMFIDGVALFKGTLFEARNDYLTTLSAVNTSLSNKAVIKHPLTGASAATQIRVVPTELFKYRVIATSNNTSDATTLAANTQLKARNNTDGNFRLVVQPIDAYGNLRAGESGISLKPVPDGNTLTITSPKRTSDASFSPTNINLSSGLVSGVGYVFNNLYYRVAQNLKWSLDGTTLPIEQSVTVNYTPHLETVKKYNLKLNNTMAAGSVIAGTTFPVTLEALDDSGNIITGIDTDLRGQTFSISGPESIGTNVPTLLNGGTTTFTGGSAFSNGVATNSSVIFYKARVFQPGELTLTDPSNRTATNTNTFEVTPAVVNALQPVLLDPQKAGVATVVKVWAYDAFGNPSQNNCTPAGAPTLTLKGDDGNGNDSTLASPGGHGGTVTKAFAVASAGTTINQTATLGYYQTALTFYNRGINRLKFSGCGKTATQDVVVNESDLAKSILLNTSSAEPAATLSTPLECVHTNTTGSNVACPTVWAFMWDSYGNRWRDGEAPCNWSYSSLLTGAAATASGAVSSVVSSSTFQTITHTKFVNGNLTCGIPASQSADNSALNTSVELYGGLAEITPTTNPTGTGLASISVGNDNLSITNLVLKQYRGGTLQSVTRARSEEYAVTASSSDLALMLPSGLTLNHDASGGIGSAVNFDLTSPVAANSSITLTARGVAATISGIGVTSGAVDKMVVGKFRDAGGVETQSPKAGDEITLDSLQVFDASNNLATCATATIKASQMMVPAYCTNLDCSATDATVPGGTVPTDLATRGLTGTLNTISFPASSKGTWNANIKFKLFRTSAAFTISVQACGKNQDFVFSVTPANATHARLATGTTAPSAADIAPEVKCALGTRLDVSCPSINAFFWDTYGNRNFTSTCTSWTFDKAASSNSQTATGDAATGLVLPSSGTTQANLKSADLSYLSGRLKCTATAGVDAIALVYGGLTSMTATRTFGGSASATTATAGVGNLVITGLQAKFKKPALTNATDITSTLTESEINKDDFAAQGAQTVNMSSPQGTLTAATYPIATAASFSCTFSNAGACTPSDAAATLSLRKVENAAREIALSVRGVSVTLPALTVTPKGANRLEASLWRDGVTTFSTTTAMTAGESAGSTIKVFDEFDNPTSFVTATTSTACTPAVSDLTGTGLTSTNSELTKSGRLYVQTSTGVYTISSSLNVGGAVGLTIKKAGTQTLTFAACGLTTTQQVLVVPAAHSYSRVTTSASAPTDPTSATVSHVRCGLNANGSGVTCSTAYAYFFDQFGNQRSDLSCPNWSYVKRATAHTSDETKVSLSSTSASVSTVVSSSDFMDGDLTCNFGASDTRNHSIHFYGGVHSLSVAHGTILTNMVAGESNIQISKLALLGPSYDSNGANYALANIPGPLASEPVSMTSNTTASNTGTILPAVTASFSCSFAANGECATATPTTAFNLNFTKVQSSVSFTVTVRGKAYTPASAFNVVAGRANATTSTYSVLDNANAVRANNNLTADDVFGVNFSIKDAFGNATDTIATADTACAASNSTTLTTTSVPNNGAGNTGFVVPTSTKESGVIGSYQLRSMRLTGIGTYTVTFTTCSVAMPITFTVSPGALAKTLVSTATAAPTGSTTATLEHIRCSINTSGSGVNCGTINAYFYDTYGNNRANDTCPAWSYAVRTAAQAAEQSLAANVSLSKTTNSAFTVVTSSDFMDGDLTCTADASVAAKNHTIHLYGGVQSVVATYGTGTNGATAVGASITAGENNITVTGITLRGPKYTAGAYSLAGISDALTNENITVTTTATASLVGTSKSVVTNAMTCSFDNTGACTLATIAPTNADKFSFTKAETGRNFTITVRGKSFTPTSTFDVNPGNANGTYSTYSVLDSANVARANNNLTADQTFGIDFTIKDLFGNLTDLTTAGGNCTASPQTTFDKTSVPNNGNNTSGFVDPASGDNTRTSLGVYRIRNARLTGVGTNYNVGFTTCGVTKTIAFTVTPGALAKTLVSTDATAPAGNTAASLAHFRCSISTTGAGVNCGAINAYFYDAYGNNRASDTCPTWSYVVRTAGQAAEQSVATNVALSKTTNSAFTVVTSTDFMDGDLTCTADAAVAAKNHTIHLYGGVQSVVATYATGTNGDTAVGASITAGENNITVTGITLRGPKYTAGTYSLAGISDTLTNENITVTTTATASLVGTSKSVVTNAMTCSFDNTGACTLATIAPTNAHKFSFTKAETGRNFTITVRGKSFTPGSTFDVNPGNADGTYSTYSVLDSANVARATNNLTTDQTFGIDFAIKDLFGNLTDLTNAGGNCTASPQTTFTTGSVPNDGNNAAGFINPTTNDRTGLGSYRIRSARLTGVGSNYNVGFTTCGVTKTIAFTVSAGPASSIYLNTSTTQSKTTVAALGQCSLTTGGGADCGTVYAWFYDAYGNNVANDTCTTWGLAARSADTVTPWTTLNASATMKVVASSALDATLTCNKNGASANITLAGGFKSIEATMPDGPTVTAATNNYRVQNITLKGYVGGTPQTIQYTVNSVQINFSTTANAGLDGTVFTNTPSTTCNFVNGVCSTTYNFSFVRADSAQRTLNVNVNGVSTVTGTASGNTDPVRLTTIVVNPAATPTSSTSTLPSTVAADATFSGDISFFDVFKNPTCSTVPTLAHSVPNSPSNTAASMGALTLKTAGVAGTFSMAASSIPTLSSAGYTLAFTACGYTANYTMKVTAGDLSDVKLLSASGRTDSQVASDAEIASVSCKHTSSSGNGVVCDPIYPYLRDNKGNVITDGSRLCTWTYTATSGTSPASIANSRALSLTHGAFLNGKIKCTAKKNDGTTDVNSANIDIGGGISKVTMTLVTATASAVDDSSTNANRTLSAGTANAGVYRIQLWSKNNSGTDVQVTTDANFTLAGEPLEFVTTAVRGTSATVNPIPASPACSFTTGVCGGSVTSLANAAVTFNLTRSGTSGMNDVQVKVRGVASNNIPLIVEPGNATSLMVSPISTARTAGSEFYPTITGYDGSGNLSLRGCTGFSMTGGLTSITGPASTAVAPSFTWTSGTFNNLTMTSVPGAAVILHASGQQALTFTGAGCNLSANLSVGVNAVATAAKYMISSTNAATNATVPSFSTSVVELPCTGLTVTGQTNAVSCPALYAYSYDTYGNPVTGSESLSCDWKKQDHGGTEAAVTSAVHTITQSSTNASPAIDQLVRCKNAGSTITSNDIRLYGGPSTLELTITNANTVSGSQYSLNATTLTAGFSNVTLSKVALKSKKAGATVTMPGYNSTAEDVAFSISTGATNAFGANPQSTTTNTVYATPNSCSFNSLGECFINAAMNFKKVDTNARTVTVTARGVSATMVMPEIVAGPAASLVVTIPAATYDTTSKVYTYSVDSYTDQNSTLSTTATAQDQFGNSTTTPGFGAADCNLTISGNEAGPYADSITYGTQPATTASMKIYKAKAHTLAYSKCGATANINLTITAGAVRRTLLTTANTQPASYSCAASGDNITTLRECDTSVQCTANTVNNAAGGAACGTFYTWHYDRAGNYIAGGSQDCTTTTQRVYTAATANAAQTASWASATGFRISAPNTTSYLEGSVRCKPATAANDLGGTKVNVIAPVTRPGPTVTCTPWLYDASGLIDTQFSLCSFKNDTGVPIAASPEAANLTLDATEATPDITRPSMLGQDIAANGYGQFIVNGTVGKKSGRFFVAFHSTDTQRVVVDNSPNLRVPLRSENDLAAVGAVNHQTAADAGGNLALAETAETDGNTAITVQTTTGTSTATYYRRPNFYMTTGAAQVAWGNTCLNTLQTGYSKCLKDALIGVKDTPVANPLLLTYANTQASQQAKVGVHTMSQDFISMDYPATGDATYCSNKSSVAEKVNNACLFALQGRTGFSGLRAVIWLKDSLGRTFYFMTEPLP